MNRGRAAQREEPCAVCGHPLDQHAEYYFIYDGSVNNCARRHGGGDPCTMCSSELCFPAHQYTTDKIDSFQGEYRFLSNFSPYSIRIPYPEPAGMVFPTSEHLYQALKTKDLVERRLFTDPRLTPGQAKSLGRRISMRDDWESVKLRFMRQVIGQKIAQHPIVKTRLLRTGDAALVEGNTWGDQFWGVARGEGLNWLGRIWMEHRARLRTNSLISGDWP